MMYLLLAAVFLVGGVVVARANRAMGLALLAVAVGLAVYQIGRTARVPRLDARRAYETGSAYHRIAGAALARNLAARHPDSTVLIVTPPPPVSAWTVSLKEGFMQASTSLRTIGPRAIQPPDAWVQELVGTFDYLPESERDQAVRAFLMDTRNWLTAELLDAFLDQQAEPFDLLLFLPALPEDIVASRRLGTSRGAILVVADAERQELQPLFENRMAAAALMIQSGSDVWTLPPAKTLSEQEAFTKRFTLITPESAREAFGR